MIKTFEEIIMNIKGHQIWKPLASDSRVKNIESIEFNNFDGVLINLDDKYDSVFIPSNMEFELEQKEVSFEEAIKAFKKGKEIQSCVNGVKYRIAHSGEREMYYNDEDGCYTITPNFSLESILGMWYINE